MRVGVLTGGGDCPGLNAVIRAVVRKGVRRYGYEFVGFRDGWRGPLEGLTMPLDVETTRGILPRGGTILGSSRTNPFAVEGGALLLDREQARRRLARRVAERRSACARAHLAALGGGLVGVRGDDGLWLHQLVDHVRGLARAGGEHAADVHDGEVRLVVAAHHEVDGTEVSREISPGRGRERAARMRKGYALCDQSGQPMSLSHSRTTMSRSGYPRSAR